MSSSKFKVSISRLAERDLRQIAFYISEHGGPEEAIKLIEAIENKIASLEGFPERGGIPSEIRSLGLSKYRQTLLSPYRIFYRVGRDAVTITLIADGRRDILTLLRDRLSGSAR